MLKKQHPYGCFGALLPLHPTALGAQTLASSHVGDGKNAFFYWRFFSASHALSI